MAKIKDITKELTGKSISSFHRKTGLPQLEETNKMQDGILDGILSQVDDAYIEKTEQSNVIHLDGSGDGVVVLDSIEGNTITDVIRTTDTYSLKNTTKSISSRWSTVGISCRQGKLNDKIYYKIKLKINNLTTDSTQLGIMSMRDGGGYNQNVALFKDLRIGNINEISTIRAIDSNCNNLYNSVTIGNHGEVPSDCTNGVEFANFTLMDFVVINLTELFGSGNEPTKEWCDNNIPYIEGLQSSFEEKVNDEGEYEIEILMNNKNLIDRNDFNINSLTNISYNPNSGIITHNGMGYGDIQFYVYLHKDTSYFLSCEITLTYTNFNVMYGRTSRYDSSLVATGGKVNSSFVVNRSGWYTIHFANSSSDGVKGTISNIQLEKNTLFNNYVSPRQNKIKVSINEPLRSLPNGIKDKLCVIDSKLMVERNVLKALFKGNESFSNATSNSENIVRFYSPLENKIYNSRMVSDKIPESISPYLGYGTEGFVMGGNSGNTMFNVSFPMEMLGLNDKSDVSLNIQKCKEWFANNNTIVLYQSQEPIYEEVLNEYGEPILLEGYENGTLYIDSNIVPTTTVRYTPKIESFKVCSEVKENNVALSSDINDNIITYMMDIDLMITEKELITLDVQAINQRMEVLDMTSMQKRTQDMLARLIKGKTLTEQECKDRIILYVNANKITAEQAEELMLLISETYQ